MPLVYIGESTFYVAVFHAHSATLCLLLGKQPEVKFYADFMDTVGPQLAELSADLTHTVLNKSGTLASAAPTSDHNRFLYFNASNMAVTQSHHSIDENGGGRERLVRLAADLAADLRRTGQTEAEVTAKLAASEEWVVLQLVGARTIIVQLHERNLNLMEVAEEVARLKKASFDNICML